MSETCWACDRLKLPHPEAGIPATEVSKDDNIALCQQHWSWWVARFLGDPETPCSAHLAEGAG